MEHEVPPLVYLIGLSITALGGLGVAWIANRRGKGVAEDTTATKPEHASAGDHAHTRDIIKAGIKRLETTIDYEFKDVHARFDRLEEARALERQSQQRGMSQKRLDERD